MFTEAERSGILKGYYLLFQPNSQILVLVKCGNTSAVGSIGSFFLPVLRNAMSISLTQLMRFYFINGAEKSYLFHSTVQ